MGPPLTILSSAAGAAVVAEAVATPTAAAATPTATGVLPRDDSMAASLFSFNSADDLHGALSVMSLKDNDAPQDEQLY
jgi:hypothetical protein